MKAFGGIEGGGTKFRCAVGTGPDDVRAEVRIDTTSPAETLAESVHFFREHGEDLAAVGLGCFGPLDLDRTSKTFGSITTTPKPGWSDTDVVGILRDGLGVPIGIDTDVGASALGEARWGAAHGLDDFVYLTVGTGIGGAVMAGGRIVHGLVHPEIGHLRLPRADGDAFAGVCPYHRDCLEGMASGVALRKRCGTDPATLFPDDPAWEFEAHYLAAGIVNLILTTSPRRIVIGGGVMEQAHIFPLVRRRVRELLAGYVVADELVEGAIDAFIVPPGLGSYSGLLGALLLGEQAAHDAGAAS